MRAAVVEGPGVLTIREWPDPADPTAGDVVIRTRVAGVCHSDVGVVSGHMNQSGAQLVPGHENMGVIEAVGSDVADVQVGQRVIVNPLLTCGRCPRCLAGEETACERWYAADGGCGSVGRARDGGFAEYLVVPSRNVISLPDSVSDAEGAIVTDAAAVTYHAVRRAAPRPAETGLVFGLGGLGQCCLRYLRLIHGLRIIGVDADPAKLEMARLAGADAVIDATTEDVPAVVRDLTGGRGADFAMEHTGVPDAVETALASLRMHGRVVMTGCSPDTFSVPMSPMSLCELSITGAHGASRGELQEILELVTRGAVSFEDLITHRFSLSRLPEALDILDGRIAAPDRTAVRIVIDQMDG